MWYSILFNRASHAGLALSLGVFVCMSGAGCIALGIPSERFDDPVDGGGIFGDFKRGRHYGPAEVREDLVREGLVLTPAADELFCGEGASLDATTEDASCQPSKGKPPKVPWPRFHPVPTRPVFGNVEQAFGGTPDR